MCLCVGCSLFTIHVETQCSTRIQSSLISSTSLGTQLALRFPIPSCRVLEPHPPDIMWVHENPNLSPYACLVSTFANWVIPLSFAVTFTFLSVLFYLWKKHMCMCMCESYILLVLFFCLCKIETRAASKGNYCDQNPNKRGHKRGEGVEMIQAKKGDVFPIPIGEITQISLVVYKAPGKRGFWRP